MEALKLSIEDLNRRVAILEGVKPVQGIPITPAICCNREDSEIDALIKELQEKAKEMDKLNNEIKELDKDDDDDAVSVNTEMAVEEMRKVDIGNVDCSDISKECKNCTKEKFKRWKTLRKEQKKEEKNKQKAIKESMKKALSEDEKQLSQKLHRFRMKGPA